MAVLMILLQVVMFFIPLVREMDYEYHAITGAFLFWCGLFSVISVRNHLTNTVTSERKEFIYSLISHSSGFVLLLVIIGFVFAAMGYLVRSCCLERSMSYFFLLPFVSAFSGLGLGLFMTVVLNRFRYTFLISIMIGSLIYNLFCVAVYPQVSVYSYFWGYFAGPVYDDWIPIDGTLILHRALSFIFALGLIVLARIKMFCHEHGRCIWPWIASAVWIGAGVLVFQSGKYGFVKSHDDLEKDLSETKSYSSVLCHADPAVDGESVEYLTRFAEFHYRDLMTLMELDDKPIVKIYVYRDHEQKKKLIGAGKTNIARIWNNEIHVNAQDAEDVIRHEMVHILANEFGHPLYGSLSAVLLEGLAVVYADDEELLTPHQWARILQIKERLPDMEQLMSQRIFFTTSTRLSYTVAGSFCRYLIEHYQMSRFKEVYRSLDFEREYGKKLCELIEEWKNEIKKVPVDSGDLALADMLLQPSYTEKPCYHAVAGAAREIRLTIENHDFEEALKLTERALQMDSSHMTLRWLEAKCLQMIGHYTEAAKSIEKTLYRKDIHPFWRARLSVLRADAVLLGGFDQLADSLYAGVNKEFRTFSGFYLETYTRQRLLKKHPARLKSYLTEPLEEGIARNEYIQTGEDSLLNLWVGKLYYDSGNWRRAGHYLVRAAQTDTILEFARCRMLTGIYTRIGNIRCALKLNERAAGLAKRLTDSIHIAQEKRLLLRLGESNRGFY